MIEQQPFFGSWNAENKKYWVETMQAHQDADRLIAGDWFEEDEEKGFVGCFFGCAMQTDEDALEKAIDAMGLPPWLIYLAERIYEGLPDDERLDFPVSLLKAIPVNTDIEIVRHKLAATRLTKLATENKSVSECINTVIELHKLEIIGKAVSDESWSAAWSAAKSAAWSAAAKSAAWSAAWSAAKSAAWSAAAKSAAKSAAWSAAAKSAAKSAESAAWSAAARSAAESAAARSAEWSAESAELLKLLSEYES